MKFFIGSGMSALQNEGSQNSGKTNWDIAHEKGLKAIDGSSPEKGTNFLEHYKEDIDFLLSMGMKHFRTSVMWPRLMPDGRNIDINAVKLYQQIFQYCLDNEIEINLTIFHWETPKSLQEEYGGWANDKIIDDYVNYAITVVKLFNRYVKKFATMNEILCFTWLAHSSKDYNAPFPVGEVLQNDEQRLQVVRRALLGHARAYHAIKQFNPEISVGIVDNTTTVIPLIPSEFSTAQDAYSDAWLNGGIIYPLLTGKLSPNFGKTVSCNGRGILTCNAKFLTDEELSLIGSAKPDWLGINNYSGLYVEKSSNNIEGYEYVNYSDTHPQYYFHWLKLCPTAVYYAIKHIRETLNYEGELIISETGCADSDIYDTGRIVYFQNVLNSIEKANNEGHNVTGVYLWTLTDNWEWTHGGSSVRFGLAHVDYETFKRTPRASSRFLADLIKQNKNIN